MVFSPEFPYSDNISTKIPKKVVVYVSEKKDGSVTVRLSDGRVWELSVLPEYVPKTFPIRKWDGVDLQLNSALLSKCEQFV